jgi:hypothetical protein
MRFDQEGSMSNATRRKFTRQLAMLLGAAPTSASGQAPAIDTDLLPIQELNLPPDVFADLKSFAQPVLAQVRYLKELPLEGVDPAFIFVPK